jgi:hypothetical protein
VVVSKNARENYTKTESCKRSDAFDDESAAVGNDQDVFVRDRIFEKKRRREKSA